MTNTIIDIFIDSNIGGRAENQDYVLKVETKLGQLAVVCDGMGGMKGGALASELASIVIRKEFENYIGSEQPLEAMSKAIQKANKVIFDKSRSDADLRGMGTTVAMLLISHDHSQAFTSHVGDSRVYQIRKGKRIFQTRDHSVVQGLVQRGEIKEKEARHHPDSNQITKALGVREMAEIEQNVLFCQPNDVFLLTSDGIHGEIDEADLLKIAAKGPNSVSIAQGLMQTCFQNGQQSKSGKHDNLTIVAIVIFQSSRKKAMNLKIWFLLSSIALMCFILILLIYPPKTDITVPPFSPPSLLVSPETIKAIEDHCNEVKGSSKKGLLKYNEYRVTLPNNFDEWGKLDINNCTFILDSTKVFLKRDESDLLKRLAELKFHWNKI